MPLGVKVELDSGSVTSTKQQFSALLSYLQQRANNTTIKINVDLANLRQVNGVVNAIVADLGRLDAQNKKTAQTMQQIAGSMSAVIQMRNQMLGNTDGGGGHGENHFGLGNLAGWLLLRQGIQLTMNSIREGFQFAVEMNKAMTDISIVTGMNQEQVGQLAKQYNTLAKAMAVGTDEIAKASVEYYRQGLSTAEVNDRMKQTIQYAKISGLALDEASTILTATVNSMDIDIKRASDVFAYLGDATATGADEIGRAFQKVGGTASALNVSFEKVSSWIAIVSSKTRESAETIGNSMKNLMARFQQIRERGFAEEDGTQFNQVTKALNEAGIQAVNSEGQFRNFGDVMDELGSKWSGLSSKTRAYIATTLAGTNQQSRFLNLMGNYEESVGLYNKSLESAGVTQQKYNRYLEGTEAHINRLKSTAQGLWLQVFNSKDLQNGIDGLTKLVSGLSTIIEKFGLLPTLIATASSAFLAMSRNISVANLTPKLDPTTNLMTGVSFNGGSVGRFLGEYRTNLSLLRLQMAQVTQNGLVMANTTSTLGMKFKALTATTIAQTVATGALEAASIALNAVIGMLAGVAISAIVAGVGHLINATKEARENVQKMVQSYTSATQEINNNIQTISGLKTEYEALTSKTSLTNEEQKKLFDVQNQIAQVAPELIAGYDKQGNAILKMGDGLDVVIKKLQEKNRLEAVKLVKGYDDAKGVYDKDVAKAQKELKRLEQEQDKINNGYSAGKGDWEHQVAGLTQVRASMAELAKQGKQNSQEYLELASQEAKLEEQSKKLNLQVEEQRGKIKDASNVIDPYREAMLQVSKGYDDLSTNARSLAKELTNNISPENLTLTSVQQVVDKLNSDEMKKAIENLNNLKMQKGKENVNEYNAKLVKIMDTIKSITGLPTDKLQAIFDARPLQNTNDALNTMKQMVEELTNNFSGATSKIEDYNKYIDEMNDKQMLSATSVRDIMSKHQELIPYLGDEAELRKKLAELIQNEEQVQQDAYVGMLEMSETFYSEKVKGSGLLQQKLGEYYTSDLDNYKSLAEAKSVVDAKLIADLSNKWGDYFSITADGMLQVSDGAYSNLGVEDGLMNHATAQLNKDIASARSKLNDIASRFKSITLSIAPINFDKINLSKTTSGKGGSSSSTSYESKLDGMDKFTAYLDDINQQLKKQDDLISDIADKAKLYKDAGDRKSLLEALKLETEEYTEQARKLATLKQDAGLVSTQQAVLAQAFKKSWGAMSGADLSNWTRTDFNKMFEQLFPTKTFKNKSQQEAYEAQKKYFNTLVDDWFKYADEVKDINNNILTTQNNMLELMQERYGTYFDVLKGDLSDLEGGINDVKSSMDMLGESENFDQRETLAQQLIAKTTTYRDTIQQTITTLTNHKNGLQEGSAEWTIVNDKIKEYEQSLKDANKNLQDTNDLLQQIKDAEYTSATSLQDKIVDAYKTKYNKEREKELETIEKNKQAKIDKANQELKDLQDELKALQDQTAEKQDQLAKEKAELELWKKDDSAYAQGKVKELEADIAKREKELAIDSKQKEIDAKQQEIDGINKDADKDKEAVEDKYKTLLDDQALYEQATKDMMTKSQDEILALLLEYDEKYKGMGTTLGKSYSDALVAQIKTGLEAVKALENGTAPAVTPDKPADTPAPPTTPETPSAITPPATPPATAPTTSSESIAWDGKYYKYGSSGDVVRRIQQNLNAIGYKLAVDGAFGTMTRNAIVDFQRKNGLSADGIVGSNTWSRLIKFDTGGYTGDWGGSGRLAVLHEKERVLNQSQTKAFEHLIYDILPKFYNQTTMSKLDTMASIIFNEPVVKNDIRIINNTPFDVDNNMDNLNKAIKQELKQAGFRLNLVR